MLERKFTLSIARKLRLHKGLTHMADISSRTLQGIERRANASPKTFKCIASVLETDFENLWKEQEMPTEEQPKMPWLSAEVKDVMEYISDIKAFYIHLFASVVAITGLTIINLFLTSGYCWMLWAAFGWGIGLLCHGISVLQVFNPFGNTWKKRQIEKRMRRQR